MNLVRRFPSLNHIFAETRATLLRFPLVLLSATLATASAIYLLEIEATAHTSPVYRLLMAAALGVPLFFAAAALAERSRNRRRTALLTSLIGIVLLALYYVSLPAVFGQPALHMLRFVLLAAGLHFMVAFLPYLRGGEVDAFWQYNKSLFIRFLTAALYSAVLCGGLAIALAAVDKLFGANIDEKLYGELFFVMAGVFNTWIFLAGVPADLSTLNQAADYPTGLKVFTQYVLLPLVAIYFVILIAYEAKILVTWNWPRGWVSELVLWYSVVGILSLLLLFPLQKRAENRWIVAFGRWFFRGLIPLVIMLFLAIYQRISDYGVTVPRYLVIGMALGLAVVVLYFVFGKRRDIRIVPVVLCVLALLATYGPQSAFSVSRASQRQRLESLMQKHEVLVDGRVRAAAASIPLEDRRQMSSIVDYLADLDGPQAFSSWFPDSLITSWQDSARTWNWRKDVTLAMGFEFAPMWRREGDEDFFRLTTSRSRSDAVAIARYDYLIDASFRPEQDSLHVYALDGDSCFVKVDSGTTTILIAIGKTRDTWDDSVFIELTEPIQELVKMGIGEVDPALLTFDASGEKFVARLLAESVSGTVRENQIKLDRITVRILLMQQSPPG